MTPIDALNWRASRQPDAVAFVADDDVWTYRRLANEAERLAGAFRGRGLRAGDRVVLHMANLPKLVVAYYACFRIGAIACPLSITFKAAELQPLLQQLRPTLNLGEARPWDELFVDVSDRSLPPCPGIDTPAVLLTTSGTTGVPKFVAHTPQTLAAIANSFLHLGLDQEQVATNALPMMHVGGLATLLGCVHFGRPMILFERFDADAVLDAMEPHRCSWLIGVPRMYAALVESQRGRPRRTDTLRTCLVAGDVCPCSCTTTSRMCLVSHSVHSGGRRRRSGHSPLVYRTDPSAALRRVRAIASSMTTVNQPRTARLGSWLSAGRVSPSAIGRGQIISIRRPTGGSGRAI